MTADTISIQEIAKLLGYNNKTVINKAQRYLWIRCERPGFRGVYYRSLGNPSPDEYIRRSLENQRLFGSTRGRQITKK